jgi:hypothetical protein
VRLGAPEVDQFKDAGSEARFMHASDRGRRNAKTSGAIQARAVVASLTHHEHIERQLPRPAPVEPKPAQFAGRFAGRVK